MSERIEWKRGGLAGVVVVLLTLLIASAAQASTRQSDAKASQAYLSAYERYLKATNAAIPREEAIGRVFAAQLRGQCPGVLRSSPGTTGLETVALVVIALLDEVQTPLMNTLSGTISRLRWSNHSLTRMVHSDALMLQEAVPVVEAPTVCQDLRSWSENHYKQPPSGFPPTPRPNFYGAEGVISSLERYEGRLVRAYSRRVRRLEMRVSTKQSEAFGQIATGVDLVLGVP